MVRLLEPTWESAVSKIGFDRDLSNFLERSKTPQLQNVGWRIGRCSDLHNIWFVNAPESGWLHGRFWKCRSKLCSYCLSNESFRRRKQLREALNAYSGTSKKDQWRFLTLTIENPSTSIASTRAIVNQAWSKLRKRVCFASVEAGVKSEEFTITREGYHYHIHTLLHFAKKPSYQQWRIQWTECVENSGGAPQKLFGFDTIDGYLIIKFEQIRDQRNISNELCKYITKSTEFQKLSKPTLLELAAQERWHRMFEMFGKLRKPRTAAAAPKRSNPHIVHTKRLSDGKHSDRQHFENKRADQRYFTIDHLERTFGAKVWTFHELAQTRRNGETLC